MNSRKEGNYWDFKEIPHDNNAGLLHDILCLANARHKGDRYLIYGVSDPSTGSNVVGLSPGMPNRKNQQQFIDFLRGKAFAGHVRPDIIHTSSTKKR
ncbi:RNA-binding domain-containing protein [Sphingobacterium ginsenosidimutans]|uniref:RNA-binding domain-containing protein n=1 Tax=Sphingobacterium ginsenosidimutans TaxID=687845 RepID=UPI003D155433